MAQKKSIFENPVLSTKVKSANAKLFPEGVLGYFLGPTLALLANSVLSSYLNSYMTNVLDMNSWGDFGKAFVIWLPVISVILVVAGNILVGRLMDHNKTRAGKARPLLLLSIPFSILALLILFVFMPFTDSTHGNQILAYILLAMGYNIWFAIAYPLYYTSHSALINLSTRNSKDRSLLATISNATALAAMGLCSMILPFCLGLLFKYQLTDTVILSNYSDGYAVFSSDYVTSLIEKSADWKILFHGHGMEADGYPAYAIGAVAAIGYMKSGLLDSSYLQYYLKSDGASIIYDQEASYTAWQVFVIGLIVVTFIGVVVEYYFTRERVTEESFSSHMVESTKKTATIKQQAKICLKDKFWWIMIVFFLMYQLGGMMKNVSQLYFCQAMFVDSTGYHTISNGGTWQGTISIIGAIPTAIGMVIAWPLSNKIGKGKAILFGSIISVIGGIIGLIKPSDPVVVIISFVIKALGSTPAMYLSLALLADILDHQEAVHGVRTDGFTMTIYGAIMVGMTGIATGILNGVLSATGYSATNIAPEALQAAIPWVFIGGETIGYGVIALIFIFMGVEKFSKFDKKGIESNQRAEAAKEGVEYVAPADKLAQEEAEAEAASEEARKAELKAKCEKKGLNYEQEEAAYQKAAAEKKAVADQKKAAAEAAKAQKAEEKKKAQEAKLAAMTAEQRKALDEKNAAKAKKKAEQEAQTLKEFNALRAANNFPAIEG